MKNRCEKIQKYSTHSQSRLFNLYDAIDSVSSRFDIACNYNSHCSQVICLLILLFLVGTLEDLFL